MVDRYFATEKFLAFSHMVGGVTLLLLPRQTSFWPFFIIMLIMALGQLAGSWIAGNGGTDQRSALAPAGRIL